jgi:hypothetical protein
MNPVRNEAGSLFLEYEFPYSGKASCAFERSAIFSADPSINSISVFPACTLLYPGLVTKLTE